MTKARKISAKLREQAALVRDLKALNPWAPMFERTRVKMARAEFGLELSDEAAALAQDAWCAVFGARGWMRDREPDHIIEAEAASLLRSGWSPGEPVHGICGQSYCYRRRVFVCGRQSGHEGYHQ